MKRPAIILALLLLPLAAFAQAVPAAPAATPVLASPFAAAKPEAYSPGEFPLWLSDLHRFETISVGVFPFAMFFSTFAVDTVRLLAHSFDARYAPWPFKDSSSIALTDDEKIGVLCIAIGISIILGLVDYFIRQGEREAKAADELRRAAIPAEGPSPSLDSLLPAGAPPGPGGSAP